MKRRRWPIGPIATGAVLSAIILAGAGYVTWTHWEKAPEKLDDIGTALSGLASPLALLWVVIATWLQREELALQRREVARGRRVLIDTKEQVEATAKENASQTRIMQETLRGSEAQTVFEEHQLRMYYLAVLLKDIATRDSLLLEGPGAITPRLFMRDPENLRLTFSITDVDKLLRDFAFDSEAFLTFISDGRIQQDQTGRMRFGTIRLIAQAIFDEAKELAHSEQYKGNQLIAARLRGVNFVWILGQIQVINHDLDVLLARSGMK